MKTINKLGLGAAIVVVITNPLTSSALLEALEWGFASIIRNGSWINLIASLGLCVWVVSVVFKPEIIETQPIESKSMDYILT